MGDLHSRSDAELEDEREALRQQYVSSQDPHEASMLYDALHRYDVEMSRRASHSRPGGVATAIYGVVAVLVTFGVLAWATFSLGLLLVPCDVCGSDHTSRNLAQAALACVGIALTVRAVRHGFPLPRTSHPGQHQAGRSGHWLTVAAAIVVALIWVTWVLGSGDF